MADSDTVADRERRGKDSIGIAVREGAKTCAIATAIVLAVHFGATTLVPSMYSRINVYPKRIVATMVIIGAFWLRANEAHGEAQHAWFKQDMAKMEARDRAALEMANRERRAQLASRASSTAADQEAPTTPPKLQ